MAGINLNIVKALRLTYPTVEALEALRVTAAADLLAGVQITNITFEGGGASGRPIAQEPGYLLEHIQAAIDEITDDTLINRPQSASMDLSRRSWGT